MAVEIIMVLWVIIGIISIYTEKYFMVNYPLVVFLVIFPLFPWIFHWCGIY